MKNIFLYDLDRALLLFLLIVDLKRENNVYVCYEYKKEMLNKLKGKKVILKDKIYNKNGKINFILTQFYLRYIRFKLKKEIHKIEEEKIKLYGSDIFWFGKELFFKEKLYVLEDGVANYTINHKKKQKSFKIIILKIIKKSINFFLRLQIREKEYGYDTKVKKIYLTENLCKEIPKGLEKKAQIINLKELWNKKSEEEKKIILDTFNFNDEILKKVDENTIMLFTQPLSEDNVITEEEKIDLYSKILKKYGNQSIIIKSHPREKTEYSKYFPNYYVMKERYPVEILELVGINIKKAITIFSSAAFGLGKNVEIDFYGTEINNKIFKRFGTQDSVMKRNAFLEEK